MAKLTLTDMEKALSGASSSIPWLSQVNESLGQFKEALALIKQLKDSNVKESGQALQKYAGNSTTAKNVFDILDKLGLGDMPIGQILTQLSPYSINQLRQQGGKFLENQSGK